MEKVLLTTNFPKLKLVKQGKVRDIFDLGENYLIVATDRLSAFDVIMNQGIPYKGQILTQISAFWFKYMEDIVPNHLVSTDVNDYPEVCKEYKDDLSARSMLVKKAKVIPIECIVRGYISGTGWNDYRRVSAISGIALPPGLLESEKLKEPLFTPSTKAEIGDHDENISFEKVEKIVDKQTAKMIRDYSINIYKKASDYAVTKGIIIADTKMEFGFYNNEVTLVDEVLTPDSSRFWDANSYKKGSAQLSFDKQFVRDYLLSINFKKVPPAPDLPEDIIMKTSEKYMEALYKLTGQKI